MTALEKFAGLPTAIATDAMVRIGVSGWMDDVLPLQAGVHMAGRARTMMFGPARGATPAPTTVYEFMRSLNPGDVLVMASGGSLGALIGDNMVKTGELFSIAGIVTDARCLDVDVIRRMPVPVLCRGSGGKPAGLELMAVDVPVVCGGAQVWPNDLVLADGDGVVVVPAPSLAAFEDELDDVKAVEESLARAIIETAPMDRLTALLKSKRRPRARAGA